MKKFFSFLILNLSILNFTYAQDYKLFKVGIGLGYASNISFSNGLSFALEPTFNLNNNLSVSFKIEGEVYDDKVKFIDILLNIKYYVYQSEKFRPYTGIGLGAYQYYFGEWYMTSLGFSPQLGFDIGHFNLALEYNIIPGKDYLLNKSINYFSARVGAYIGGGKKSTQKEK